ncbi:hypothetical protein K8Z61_05330 [Nocardioides sp. TRM66260-LWL]|uniref:acVLRF1 family peptidyl-tRNA hydrolase n=1 Tax=Nocardioides sp. TRM66260-LWL TaxID=2874478 RepID=UPI001CC6C3A7|nr:acVLRF1 family peptidyl-tRNA hydrolase [Nocardioides sp. TRM66260-LWL]MBZ5733911.1 hypothetical protein [Nocardioides sp. TRM66260-LWL]
MSAQRLLLPAERVVRWVANVADRHPGLDLAVEAGALCGRCDDGTTFTLTPPFGVRFDGDPTPEALVGALVAPDDWGVLLVRKGGFAVARLHGRRVVASKVGQRHVQGRTKAGGQSQQRFARRRDNQARQAYDAAADHAVRLLEDLDGPLVCGGDRPAVDAVLADPRLRRPRPDARWLPVPDPRRAVLEQAVVDALAVEALVDDPTR